LLITCFPLTTASKITPSLLQFTEGFRGHKIGSDCDEGVDNIVSGLKALIMGQNKDKVVDPTGWKDAVSITCYDRADVVDRQAKDIPVEELVSHMIGYLKDCAEDYLTRKPIRKTNRIDGSEVEVSATPALTTSPTASIAPSVEVNRVVMGVPANFTESSKKLLKGAAQLAGFQEVC
jgi:molecular chaperone DnaK (HSP70)